MKNVFFKRRKLLGKVNLMFLALLLLMAGCAKTDTPRSIENPSVAAYLSNDPKLTLFAAALKRSGLNESLSTGGPYTVFAPIDSAFTAAGLTLDKIQAYNVAELRSVISYHIVKGRVSSSDLIGFFVQTLGSLNPRYEPTIIKNYYGIYINGVKTINTGTLAADGAVQKVGKVIFPPLGNLIETVSAQPNLTFITAILKTKNYYLHKFFTTDAVTLMAPTDSAFKAAGFTISKLMQTDTLSLYRIMSRLTADNAHFSPEFVGGEGGLYGNNQFDSFLINNIKIYDFSYDPPVYQGNFSSTAGFTVSYNGLELQTIGNQSPPRIIKKDIIATNGVLHIINAYVFQRKIYY